MSVKIQEVVLSSNPNTAVVESQEGINGQLNKTSDGALFCVVRFVDTTNPFKHRTAVRTYRQNDGKWTGGTPAQLVKMKGATIPAKFMTLPVEAYPIVNQSTGVQNMCTTYTTIVMEGENPITVFKNAGHVVVGTPAPTLVEVNEVVE